MMDLRTEWQIAITIIVQPILYLLCIFIEQLYILLTTQLQTESKQFLLLQKTQLCQITPNQKDNTQSYQLLLFLFVFICHYQSFTNPSYPISIQRPICYLNYLFLKVLFKSTYQHTHPMPQCKRIQFILQFLQYFHFCFFEPFLITAAFNNLLCSYIGDWFSTISFVTQPKTNQSIKLVV